MKLINDFALGSDQVASEYLGPTGMPWPDPIPERPPPTARLRYVDPGWLGISWIYMSLYYRGAHVGHIFVKGGHFSAQLETQKGFLLVSASVDYFLDRPKIYVTYLLNDFSGAEMGEFRVSEPEPWRLETVEGVLKRVPEQRSEKEDWPEPVERIEIRGEDQVDFFIRYVGWCRVTLFEDPPRRLRLSDGFLFEHFNSGYLVPKYFSVKRLSAMHQSPVNWA